MRLAGRDGPRCGDGTHVRLQCDTGHNNGLERLSISGGALRREGFTRP